MKTKFPVACEPHPCFPSRQDQSRALASLGERLSLEIDATTSRGAQARRRRDALELKLRKVAKNLSKIAAEKAAEKEAVTE